MVIVCQFLINADDLGYCKERDDGIIECITNGTVKNVSLLVNGSSAVYAAEKIRELVNKFEVTIGLHLNFTEGKPITQNLHTLVDQNNEMLGKFGFREALAQNKISSDEIQLETRAQIKLYKKLIQRDDGGNVHFHFDSHQHVHVLPQIATLITEIFYEEGFKTARIPSYILDSKNLSPFLQNVVNQAQLVKNEYLKYFKSTNYFIGLDLMDSPSVNVLQHNLEALLMNQNDNSNISIEWMCHPGYRSIDYGDDFSRSQCRETEKKFLLSQELSNFLASFPFEISSWSKL